MQKSLKSIFLFSLITTITTCISAQSFYDLDKIQTIEITFEESNWDQLLDNAKATTEDYILAKSVNINGEVFDSVGVKYKGNSTYQANQTKNPFHIELDTYKEHDYEGYTDIKLSNVSKDPSFLREVLSYQVLRQYMDAPLSNYANVYVNGNLIGLYSNSESVSKKFVNSRFGSKKNTFVKCNPPAGAGPQSSDFPNLEYLGLDSSQYYDAYELKSETGWNDLINLCDVLENDFSNIEQTLDIDRSIWMLAFNNVLVNLDSYTGGFSQNYYLYKSDNGQFIPIVWDLNESLGKFSMTGSGNLNNTNSKINMSPYLHENDNDFPLIQQILSNDRYRKMYVAHVKTMLQENFANSAYVTIAEELRALIDADVQADDNKFFTYANFVNNLTSDVSSGGGGGPGGGGSTPGIVTLMDGRSDYILGLSEFTAPAPEVLDISFATLTPIVGEDISVSVNISNANFAYIGYRNDDYSIFNKVEMSNDGNGEFKATIPVNDAFTQYYVYTENNNAGIFSPLRAEHEYHTLLATSSNPIVGDIVINELLASNDETASDQDGEFDDWVELYNNSANDIDLSGYALTDDSEDLEKWIFPDATTIQANGYLVIWADNDEDQEGLHASFKLSASGESLLLVNSEGEIVDEVTFGEQTTDVSYGRFENGTGEFQSMLPTFEAMNTGITSTKETDPKISNLLVYPNPSNEGFITISISNNTVDQQASIYNVQGKKMTSLSINQELNINISKWPNGLYFLEVGGLTSGFVKI